MPSARASLGTTPSMLPTPAPSTELHGKRASFSNSQIDQAFSLPPAAIVSSNASSASSSTSSNASDSSYRPISPLTLVSNDRPKASAASRRRAGTANQQSAGVSASNLNEYTLPPPPMRSRKIIQMKPRVQQDAQQGQPSTDTGKAQAGSGAAGQNSQQGVKAQAGQKRKQPNGPTTAAGRKIARKTAHSLIERRRRSKMNEEFAVLKDMIPACSGQDMHKLQVLSASIEYMRYLESCLAELKDVHSRCPQRRSSASSPRASYPSKPAANTDILRSQPGSEPSDDEMSDATPSAQHHLSTHSHTPSTSPAILPSSHTSPILAGGPSARTYSFAGSSGTSLPSPALDISNSRPPPALASYATFHLTSPALGAAAAVRPPTTDAAPPTPTKPRAPETSDDHEATAALLMLNTDRRSWTGSASGARGMSVRDLLSS